MPIFAIRTKHVAKFPPNIPCPFQEGAFMAEDFNGYGGSGLKTVFKVHQITFYETQEEAEDMIARCAGYAATFEVVTFEERRSKS